MTTVLHRHPLCAEGDVRLLRVRSEGTPEKSREDEPDDVLAEAYDYAAEQVIRVRGPARALATGDLDVVEVDVAAYQPPPSNEELELAFETVRRDDRFGRLIAEEALVPYAPMPPVAPVDLEDGRTERIITVGMHDERGMTRHLVGVRARDRVVLADLPLLPQPAERACEHSPAFFDCPFSGWAGQVWVSVFLGGTRIWRFQLVRPAASSGTNGSDAELRFVDYRGHRVLDRAHADPAIPAATGTGASATRVPTRPTC